MDTQKSIVDIFEVTSFFDVDSFVSDFDTFPMIFVLGGGKKRWIKSELQVPILETVTLGLLFTIGHESITFGLRHSVSLTEEGGAG